ncbi:eCIS core domain-containing protein [Desulfopila aestuarii]|uniref:eCIS core domain-containing protein n=1 Tax=Desulfopila aestuarii DSM 18488 TaxID=1121416 RepID=A0A1M7XYP8_9BACT|nr:DUF4157 domain-containing protein [Desulfopila aestuarii]SHO44172.1 protein of unknown function [Desulfopila aestuarii DSM 18488]
MTHSHVSVMQAVNTGKDNAPQQQNSPDIVRDVLSSPGQALEENIQKEMNDRFQYDFSTVRIHTDQQAAESAASVDAQAYTVGNHVVFNRGQYAPTSSRGRQSLSHELAHVIQQEGTAMCSAIPLGALHDSAEQEADQLSRGVRYGRQPLVRRPLTLMRQPTSLQTIPLSERRAIQVSTMAVTIPNARIVAFFRLMPSGNPGERRSVGATNSYSPNIPAALKVGLASIGAWIQGDTNALPLNSSIEVDLDLSNFGGSHSTYRFTYFTHASGRGRSRTTANIMLIEQVGNAVAAPAGQAAPANSFTIGSSTFNLSGTWTNDEYAVLRQALGLLPAQAMSDAAGVTFSKSGSSGSAAEAGNYDPATDTISLHNNAFPSSSVRVGQRSLGAHNVLHEIGHALDLRVLQRAWNTFNAAGQPASARAGFLGQRSPSGSRQVRDAQGDYNVEQSMDDTSGAFRQAARRDQVRRDTSGRTTAVGSTATLSGGVTSYADTDYQELFAEAFALYISAPETLRQLRPNIYTYFNSRYPRPRTP